MAISHSIPDLASIFNSLYNIQLDLSGWSVSTIQVVAPVNGAIAVYASNDDGSVQGQVSGSAQLATNFTSVEVTNLATHAVTTLISSAGNYKYDVNAQFLKLQGVPPAAGTNIYKLLIFNQKVD